MRNIRWVAVLAVGLCWIGRATPDEAEDRAVAAIEKLGGEVEREKSGNSVIAVRYGPLNKKLTDDGLKELKGLVNLKSLTIIFCEQMESLASFMELHPASRSRCRVLSVLFLSSFCESRSMSRAIRLWMFSFVRTR